MENLRERTRKEVENTSQFAIQKFAKDLLNVVDILNCSSETISNRYSIDLEHDKLSDC